MVSCADRQIYSRGGLWGETSRKENASQLEICLLAEGRIVGLQPCLLD